ncbi:uncharacterized protein LOC109817332 [Cajanus cajan]|uniref:uncharacterized protein LOC109817332 n=1 Tax=Cajanus cajan TaxID=3821 RepID=UPI0010FB9AC2|nr:uncharacterized protein LOC109817332 [Cajanus cajan]
MDLNGPTRFRKPALSSTERFLGVPTHAPRNQNPPYPAPATEDDDDDLIEDDVVFSHNDHDSTEPSSSSSSSFSIPNHHNHHHKAFAFGPPDAFGILAALPENDHLSPNGSHLFHHKPSVSVSLSSSSSSSSSRPIPAIPKPPPDRTPSSSVKFHQSAPVNVPVMPQRRRRDFDDDDGGDAVEDEEMLPPHEIVARNAAQSPMMAYSVLEGVGRTLKGRDLRQMIF